MCSDLTEALEELKTCALEVRLKEREATQATEDLKQRLKESSVDDKRRSTTRDYASLHAAAEYVSHPFSAAVQGPASMLCETVFDNYMHEGIHVHAFFLALSMT